MAEKNKKIKPERQDWKPHWSLDVLYKIWRVIFTTAKIALGAAATVLLIVVVCGIVLMGVLGNYLEEEILPSASLVLENYDMDEPSYIYFVNSQGQIEELQKIHASTLWKNAEYEDIPKDLIHAAVAIEDKRFYEHQGVDWFTTVKAFANMFFGDETVGGSSITQQLIKNRTKNDSVTVQRKVLEFFQASLVEKNYDKQTIMELYMNSIYLGQGCRGVRAAAEAYFGKELQKLTTVECAALISITNNPSLFDPYSDEEFTYAGEIMNGQQRNKYRRDLVLGEMLSQEYITQEQYDEAVAVETLALKSSIDKQDRWIVCPNEDCDYEEIAATYGIDGAGKNYQCPNCGTLIPVEEDNSQEVYSYFVDTVLEDVAKQLAQKNGITEWNDDIWKDYMELISRSGYHIYSTYNEDVQAAVDAVYKDLDQIPSPGRTQLQSAIVIVDNETGDIVAMAGGVGDEKAHFGQNRATGSKLQSGSSIKPLTIYAPGFQQGSISPATVIKDMPLTYSGGAWPKNDNRKYAYSYTIYRGVTRSVNAVAANTLKIIGENYGFEFGRDSFGLSTLVEPDDLNFASLAMGAQHNGVTVRDMTCAFATFANDGVYREGRTFTKVYDRKGNLVLDNTQDARTILSEKANTYMNYCLVSAANSGTGTGALFSGHQIAGKTGTTSSSRDRWFCGYTDYYTAAIWCGYDTPAVINLSYNPSSALWRKVMMPIHEDLEYKNLYSTSKMTYTTVCLDSGKRASEACKNDIRGDRTYSVLVYPEDRPYGVCTQHVQVDYCTSGNGVATEYCKHFAEKDKAVKFAKKSLLKLTQGQFDEIKAAKNYGLEDFYTTDNYVYMVDNKGNDMTFTTGFNGTVDNKGVSAPYKVCTVHTKKAWDDYVKAEKEKEEAEKEKEEAEKNDGDKNDGTKPDNNPNNNPSTTPSTPSTPPAPSNPETPATP